MNRQKIAIIGTGISGLVCGYRLAPLHDITMFEANDYIGGHTHTVAVEKDGERAHIDTGFIVFNDRTYPNFIRLLDDLQVVRQKTEMSFSVRNDTLDLEYNGGTLPGLFAQKKNLIRPGFWRMLRDIVLFNRDVKAEMDHDSGRTIGAYLDESNFSPLFRDNYLLPMIGAIWSMGLNSCRDFPLHFFARFFTNHGLLDLTNRPQWYTIVGGSSSYIAPLTAAFHDRIRCNTKVSSVYRTETGVVIESPGGKEEFDEVILACHGDQALQLLDRPTPLEQQILGQFRCTDNLVLLHTDTTVLPRRKAAWASWNYTMVDAEREKTTLSYNMNILQRLQTSNTYLVTLNQQVDLHQVLGEFHYRHPVYTTGAIAAQQRWREISGSDRIHYCGAYWFNGFHEDGVRSALRVCKQLGAER